MFRTLGKIRQVSLPLIYPHFLPENVLENVATQDKTRETIECRPSKSIIQNCFCGTYTIWTQFHWLTGTYVLPTAMYHLRIEGVSPLCLEKSSLLVQGEVFTTF